jgi:CBS domain-containing protein
MHIITLTKKPIMRPLRKGLGAPELELVAVGTRGVTIYPGQSAEEVLAAAEVIRTELDVGIYTARDVARKTLLAASARRKD